MTTTHAPIRPSPSAAILEPRFVGDIEGSFFVPSYQRGYRWTPVEVKQLLDDIWNNRTESYYLQPVVVKSHERGWELIDGQQRLTTLFLIMQYMEEQGLQSAGANYSISYETREGSAEFLNSIDPERAAENVDFHHMYRAYRTIDDWFSAHDTRRQHAANSFYGALFESARIIWYQADDDVDATTLFRRLNVGRIPLTDAELVKALLLSTMGNSPETASRAYETAAQWDQIEKELREPELWAFITGSAQPANTHIGLLLDTLAGGPRGIERPLFHTFLELQKEIPSDPIGTWNRVVELHDRITGWFRDHDLFHQIGYLITEGRTNVPTLVETAEGKRHSEFSQNLDEQIRTYLNLTESRLRDLAYGNAATGRALLLMNVETIRRQPHTNMRYSFHHHARGHWSQEHIHAQNAEPLNSLEQWRAWLILHRGLLGPDDAALVERTDSLLAQERFTQDQFRGLEQEYLTVLSADAGNTEDIDSIANLALLDSGSNSALSNSVFAVKRERMIRLDQQGEYIPICTRNAFLKYYSPADEMQPHFWSRADREGYLEAIVETLRPYLGEEKE